MHHPVETPHAPRVVATIVDGPLTRERETAALAAHEWTPASNAIGAQVAHGAPGPVGVVGAVMRFEGIVRRKEPQAEPREENAGGAREEHDLLALDYQTYDPMAERELLTLSRGVVERHGLTALAALHSRGRVGVGEVSFVLIVESVHRAEALAAMADFIDRLKQDVPIWKRPVWR